MSNEPQDLAKAYDPSTIESKWAAYWVEHNIFATPPAEPSRPSFTMLLPPPNVTGRLHMGHMLNQAEMDILTRWHRMSGPARPLGSRHRSRRHRHPDDG